jgi:hypothetical protein
MEKKKQPKHVMVKGKEEKHGKDPHFTNNEPFDEGQFEREKKMPDKESEK